MSKSAPPTKQEINDEILRLKLKKIHSVDDNHKIHKLQQLLDTYD